MAQPTAVLTVNATVRLIAGTATPNIPTDESFTMTSTVGTYATDTTAYSTTLWNFLVASGYVVQSTTTGVDQLTTASVSGGVNAALEDIQCIMRIQNLTAPAPHYEDSAYGIEKENRNDFAIGPADFSSQATLQTVLNTKIAAGVAFTNY